MNSKNPEPGMTTKCTMLIPAACSWPPRLAKPMPVFPMMLSHWDCKHLNNKTDACLHNDALTLGLQTSKQQKQCSERQNLHPTNQIPISDLRISVLRSIN
ncbi:hypothetical protein M758_1G267900 [Ceratodon purpureus]|uniref:Uncharacterized protein n=1 Tax=Ceratodon purpureus TaxID=3225 RepID=A0A8T0JD13_CERPU|nr:hypothetical protein KC19_1G275600 [Ceratodon purpureus]KAG0592718.1 hypothetical protein KC19_1G275800 [Ceratodon purpureus]KAG0631625.1 hypothetical protein M758_1G267700 [Ceratodon purpureus]KAG0631627.1 hypothetical protein M758_1G267900 [Ceratodon purpureus]